VSGPLGGGVIDTPCTSLGSTFDVDVTVEEVALVPPNEELVLAPERCAGAARSYGEKAKAPCGGGVVLRKGEGCYSGIGFKRLEEYRKAPDTPDKEYTAAIHLTLRAVCTSADVTPCSDDEVVPLHPSATNPVQIRWTGSCRVCLVRIISKKPATAESPAAAG